MYKTTTELATAVLRHLGELASDGTIDTEDETYITGVYNDKWDQLSDESWGLFYWERTNIPKVCFLTVRDLITNEVKSAYGHQQTVAQKDMDEAIILKALRRHVAVRDSGHPVRAEYF